LSSGLLVKVFTYGSNMLTARILERAPSAQAVTIGSLKGYQLCWHKKSRDGSGKCGVTETGFPQHVVWGVVYEMNVEDKLNLDRAEQGYEVRAVMVITQIGDLAATTYYPTSGNPDLRPYDWYRNLVVAGARGHLLPQEYVVTLQSIVAINDNDVARAEKSRLLLARHSRQ
jgi:gamma-glutamylcyclotransferase